MKIYRVFLLPLFLFLFSCQTEQEDIHPFEKYLSEVQPSYSYELEHTIEGDGYEAYVIKMVSQKWLTEDLVDDTEWWHWLTIVVPENAGGQPALLWIGGGSKNDETPDSVNPVVLNAALATQSVTADLHNVPFQPISFKEDERLDQRYEDDLIAYGWRKFLEGGAKDEDAIWLSRLPMTAAAMRAMDTVTDFSDKNLNLAINEFVVSGASKRGWTTWTTGIFDDRVIAIAPIVIDLLNITPSFEHHWQAYGEWSPAIEEYENEHIMDWQFSGEYSRMLEIVDPYSYLDELTMPKFIINAASDEFFLPDSWQFYWDDLPEDKFLRYIPNTGHSLSETDAAVTLASFHHHIINNRSIPQFKWTADTSGFRVELDPDNLPDELLLWNAYNPDGRDFRLYVIDRIWVAQQLVIENNGEQFIEINTPETGYSAWFVEATFGKDSELPLKQTTGVVVTPDTYPFEPFAPQDSLGTIPAKY